MDEIDEFSQISSDQDALITRETRVLPMNFVQITPGAGKMFCGGCFRDNALVRAMRKAGHTATMIPLYLPLTLEDEDQSQGTKIFFSGINVYLEQKSEFFRHAPRWLHNALASRALLKLTARRAVGTKPEKVGDLMLSMLRGEEGHQARELNELIEWLKTQPKPDVVSLSNALLVGLARKIKSELQVPVVCSLQGEDSFLDALPENYRESAWRTLAERAKDIDLFIAPSRYFGDLISRRLDLRPEQVATIYNGIDLTGFEETRSAEPGTRNRPVIGFFARMCKEKGLDLLVDAYIELRQRGTIQNAKLKIGGSLGPTDEEFVDEQREKLKAAELMADVEFLANLSRAEKIAFLQSLSVFSVPARYGEAFGLYVIEAMAAGVPVVQPKDAAFPELIDATGGGIVCEPENATALADGLESLLSKPEGARAVGEAGRKAIWEKFTAEQMGINFAQACSKVAGEFQIANRKSEI